MTAAVHRWALLLGMVALLAACTAPTAAPAPTAPTAAPLAEQTAPRAEQPVVPPTAPRQALRVAYTSPVATQAPLWIGVESGAFREQGLDVEVVFISGSDKATAAVVSGEVPITLLATNALVSAAAQGADLVFVASGASKL